MSKEVAISVENVSKSFRLPIENSSGLKQTILNLFRKNRKKGYINQHVLRGVSFDIEKGDFFGIVGRNGSGKSTLLKIISDIYTPDKGSVTINGSLTPFIELGVGFNPELTGRENVFLNGALLGFSRKEMEAMYDEIVEFAELEKFMDQKLKNYSSGMQVRLAFSIAIRADTDILVLDEVLAVGDEAFQRKCNEYFQKVKKEKKKTIILVTHSMDSVRKYCNKAIMINEGKLVVSGDPEVVSSSYSLENLNSKHVESTDTKRASIVSDFSIKLVSKTNLKPGDLLSFDLTYTVNHGGPINFGISVIDKDHGYTLLNDGLDVDGALSVERTFRYEWKIPNISDRKLSVVATLNSVENGERRLIAFTGQSEGVNFIVTNNKVKSGALITDKGSWDVVK